MFEQLRQSHKNKIKTNHSIGGPSDRPKKFAAIIGVPVWIVRDVATLLSVINSKHADIDPDEFEKFCDQHLEKWYNSPQSWNRHNPTVRDIHIVISIHFVLKP